MKIRKDQDESIVKEIIRKLQRNWILLTMRPNGKYQILEIMKKNVVCKVLN